MGRTLRVTRVKKQSVTQHFKECVKTKSNILHTSNARSGNIVDKKSTKQSEQRSVLADRTNKSGHTSTDNSMSLRKRNVENCSDSKQTPQGGYFKNGVIQSPRTRSLDEKSKFYSIRKLRFERNPIVVLEQLDEQTYKCVTDTPKENIKYPHNDCVYTNNSSLSKVSQGQKVTDKLAVYEFEVDENEPCVKKKKKKRRRKKKILSDTSEDESFLLGSVIKKLRRLETSSPICSQEATKTCMTTVPVMTRNMTDIALPKESAMKHTECKLTSSTARKKSEHCEIQNITSENISVNVNNSVISSLGTVNKLESPQERTNARHTPESDTVLFTEVLQEHCEDQNTAYKYVNSRRRLRLQRSPSIRSPSSNLCKEDSLNCTASSPLHSSSLYNGSNPRNKSFHQLSILSFLEPPQRKRQKDLNLEESSMGSVVSTSCTSNLSKHENHKYSVRLECSEKSSLLPRVSEDALLRTPRSQSADLTVDNCFGFDEEPEDMLPFCSPVHCSNSTSGVTGNVSRAPFAISSTPAFKDTAPKPCPTRISPPKMKYVSPLCTAKTFHEHWMLDHNITTPSTSLALTASTSLPTMLQPTLPCSTEIQRTKEKRISPVLFQEIDIPVHFNKPPRKSYERRRKRKLMTDSMQNKTSEEEDDGCKERSAQKPKKKYSKRDKQTVVWASCSFVIPGPLFS